MKTSPLSTQQREANSVFGSSTTNTAYAPDSATAVDGSADKCGSSAAASLTMSPADFQATGHAPQHILSTVQPSSQPEVDAQLQEQGQPGKQPGVEGLTAQTDSEDDSWTPGQPQSSADAENDAENDYAEQDEEEETWDPNGPPPRYCTNCTARLRQPECSDCGHSSEHDNTLFECSSSDAAVAVAGAQQPIIIWDDEMLLHEEGKAVPHPERPDRLRAIMARLTGNGLADHCQRVSARTATKAELLRVHTPDHLHRLQMFCSGTVPATSIPSDTYINQHTLHCAALAAGSAAEVACRVVRGEAACGAAIIRPPGHHAESNTAMGFCFFNNAAVAARAAQAAGAERVLILDWDVHHGNGTQHIFEGDPSVLYMSLHRYDRGNFYPGTGSAEEVGHGRGAGYTVNVPWDAGNIQNGDYIAAMQQVILPIAREFAPNLILISAGFDAADGDPIGGCCLTPECFGNMTALLMPIAPTVLLLEGGYNLLSTALSTEACLRVLLGEQPQQLPERPSAFGWLAIQAAKKAHSRYWSCLAGAFPQLHHSASLQQQLRLVGSGLVGPAGHRAAAATGDDVCGEEYGDEYEAEYEDDDEGGEGYGGDDDDDVDVDVDGHMQGDDEQQQGPGLGFGVQSGFGYGFGQRRSCDGQSSFRQSHVGGGLSRASDVRPAVAAAAAGEDEVTGRSGWLHQHQQRVSLALSRRQLQHRLAHGISRKQQMLRAIHRRAMKTFWARRSKRAAQQQQQQQQRLVDAAATAGAV